MSYLLGFGQSAEAYILKILAASNIDRFVESMYAEKATPNQAAMDLWTVLFVREIENSPELFEDRERILDYVEFGRGEPRYDTEDMLRRYFVTAARIRGLNVTRESYAFAIDEIVGALNGYTREQRSAARLSRLLYEDDEGASP